MEILNKINNSKILNQIDKMIDNEEISSKYVYEKASFPILYHLSKHRKNIIDWYEFKKNSKILHLGAGTGIITQSLAETGNKIIAVDANEELIYINKKLNKNLKNISWHISDEYNFLNNCKETVDYVVLDGILEVTMNPQNILELVNKILSADGQVIIVGFNKFGLKYFSGSKEFYSQKVFEGLEGYPTYNRARTFSKNEYASLLKKSGFSHVNFYYPYPDHLFSEMIFSEKRMPTYGELHNNIRNFDSDKVVFFNESKVYNELINSNNFDVFSNSFFIVASNNELKGSVVYCKFSRERKEQYQISTSIVEKNNKKYVEKKALTPNGVTHLRRMSEFYRKESKRIDLNEDIRYCPVKFKENKLIFEFTYGISLEKKLKECVIQENKEMLDKYVGIILKILNIETSRNFEYTDKFLEVFGDIDGLNGLEAIENVNVDLIPDNIILNDKINIIDYEWLYDFMIPKEFILFRSLFHSEAISLLPSKDKYEIFENYGLDKEKREKYLNMEVNFQNYVADKSNTLLKVLNKMNKISYNFENMEMRKVQKFSILGDGKEIFRYKYINKNEIIRKIELDNYKEIKIVPTEKNCILKIKEIIGFDGDKESNIPISKINADIIENNNYYFNKKPEIILNSNNLIWLKFDILIYCVDDNCIPNIIDLTKSNNNINRILRETQSKLDGYRRNIFVKILRKIRLLKE